MIIRAQCHGLVGCDAVGPASTNNRARAYEAAKRVGWHVSGRVAICPKCVSAMKLSALDDVEIGNAPRKAGEQ